jgi:hypothetical protein
VGGGFGDQQFRTHGFIWTGVVDTQLDVPGAIYTIVAGISPQKDVVGQYYDTYGKSHGFIVSP